MPLLVGKEGKSAQAPVQQGLGGLNPSNQIDGVTSFVPPSHKKQQRKHREIPSAKTGGPETFKEFGAPHTPPGFL
ncbi:hypothetical protein C0995_012891 [Termitomyces sp. Mi166|nr:hypothetical protein C0995_012891 [Termitomyces sp. Mi166\